MVGNVCVYVDSHLRVRLHYQFCRMPGLPHFPEKMAYVIHTEYQYRRTTAGSPIIRDRMSSGS